MAPNKEQQQKSHFNLNPFPILKHSFHTLSLTLLTLLLPLSFLLISKLTSSSIDNQPSFLILRFLVSSLSISSLLYSLTGHLPKPRPSVAWAIVCVFQACITLGIEATITAGIKTHSPTSMTRLICVERAVFFLGLYETMLHWMRAFVKTVVDDTIYGVEVEEGKIDRAAIWVAFGCLWIWLLRDEVDPLVTAAGKRGFKIGIDGGWNGFVVWVVSYSTVVTGMVKAVEIVFCVGSCLFLFLFCRRGADHISVSDVSSNDEVVLLL